MKVDVVGESGGAANLREKRPLADTPYPPMLPRGHYGPVTGCPGPAVLSPLANLPAKWTAKPHSQHHWGTESIIMATRR